MAALDFAPAICDIGLFTKTTDECTDPHLSRSQKFDRLSTLGYGDQELLTSRTRQDNGMKSLNLAEDGTMLVCKRHYAKFVTGYESKQRYCINPHQTHRTNISKALRSASKDNYILWERQFRVQVNPGDKVCTNCLQSKPRIENDIIAVTETEPDVEECNEARITNREDLNNKLSSLDCSPIKLRESVSDPRLYGQKKLEKIVSKLKTKIGEVSPALVESREDDVTNLVNFVKEKMKKSSYQEKIQLLTLAPKSWTYDRIMSEFGVTRHMVRRSQKVLQDQGVLGKLPAKNGRALSQDTITKLLYIVYTDQEFTRELAGERNTVSIRDQSGVKTYHQKHLLLMNLRELHHEYKE